MDDKISQRLREINYQFYQSFAVHFSDTRRRLQPGIVKIIDLLPSNIEALDLGCGNGEFADRLIKSSFSGGYIGLDFSEDLLRIASDTVNRETQADFKLNIQFLKRDISKKGWNEGLSENLYKEIFAFAVLHHIPGLSNRYRLVEDINKLLKVGGLFYLSVWQFLNSERLRQRIVPWETIGLSDAVVDDGDYLLDWRRGGRGMRYVNLLNSRRLKELAEQTGFIVVDEFYSDGYEGKLGLYHVWQKDHV